MAQINQIPQSKELLVWQRPEWPYFQWDSSALLDSLVKLRHEQGKNLAYSQLMSSKERPKNGSFSIQEDISVNFNKPLTKERLFGWQASLFPTGYSGINKIVVGDFRKKDILNTLGHPTPPYKNLNESIKKLTTWWNDSPVGLDGIIRAGIAYFWLITLFPFEDGNEQIGFALISMALAQDENAGMRPYFLNKILEIEKTQKMTYECQKKDGDITPWLQYFFESLLDSLKESNLDFEIKSKYQSFLKKAESFNINIRQKKILASLATNSSGLNFISNRQCVEICKTSRETIKRDLKKLVDLGLLVNEKKQGRSVTYFLKL